MNVSLGCSGWSYDEWVGYLYETKTERKLKTYSALFSTAEIDSTFYAMPTKGLVLGWLKNTSPDFVFTAKIPKTITHDRLLAVDENLESELYEFLSLMKPLNTAGKLGCLLIQLPPRLKFREEAVSEFFSILPRDFRYCIEFRNASWTNSKSFSLLERYNIGYTVVDEPLLPPVIRVTSDIAYIRWHGQGSKPWYNYYYSPHELEPWIPRIGELSKKAKRVFGYFNNHYHGYAPENCLDVLSMLGLSSPAQEDMREKIKGTRLGRPAKGTLESFLEKGGDIREHLLPFLQGQRLARAEEIGDEVLHMERVRPNFIRGLVKEYFVEINVEQKTIRHNCEDWSRQLQGKTFCKHLGKVFLSLDEKISFSILSDITKNGEQWNFEFGEE